MHFYGDIASYGYTFFTYHLFHQSHSCFRYLRRVLDYGCPQRAWACIDLCFCIRSPVDSGHDRVSCPGEVTGVKEGVSNSECHLVVGAEDRIELPAGCLKPPQFSTGNFAGLHAIETPAAGDELDTGNLVLKLFSGTYAHAAGSVPR